MPVINPKGLYWVKLYHMGKPRQIVIDDRIPCNKAGENLLPRTENVDELWPAILTKALIKLFSYKFKSILYHAHEVGDLHILYALTGYIPENINFNLFETSNENNKNLDENDLENKNQNSNGNKFLKVQDILKSKLSFYISDENYFYKKNYAMIYNHTPVADLFNLEKPLYNHSPKQKNKLGNTRKILMLETNTNDTKKIGRTKTPKFLSKNKI